jgi:hypothetical protein
LADGTVAPPSVETLIAYPGAADVSHEKQLPQDQSALSYWVAAPAKDVLKFYADRFAQDHWSIDQAYKVPVSAQTVSEPVTSVEEKSYAWRSREGAIPWTPALTLSVQETGTSQNKKTYVAMALRRVPSLSHLPVYPQAEQVRYVTKPLTTFQDTGDRRTTYVTKASPEQVLAFYQGVLPQCGWQADPTSVLGANVLHYKWSVESMHFTTPGIPGEPDYFLAVKAESVAGADGSAGATSVTVDVNAVYTSDFDY